MTDLRISIVIPAWNESDTIIPCLKACINQTILPFEILVVDNKSTDSTVSMVQQFFDEQINLRPELKNVFVLTEQSEFQGLIPTRNHGLNMATGDVVGRIDADAIIRPDWVENVQKVFANKKVMAATGPVTYYDMPFRRTSFVMDRAIRSLFNSPKRNSRILFGTNMAVRKSAWLAVGKECCLDAEDLLHEDMDITIHFAKHGFEIAYVEDMVAGMSSRRISNSLKDFNDYQNRAIRTFEKHNVKSIMPQLVKSTFMTIYFPLHAIRPIYQKRYLKHKELLDSKLWIDNGLMTPLHTKITNEVKTFASTNYKNIRHHWKGL